MKHTDQAESHRSENGRTFGFLRFIEISMTASGIAAVGASLFIVVFKDRLPDFAFEQMRGGQPFAIISGLGILAGLCGLPLYVGNLAYGNRKHFIVRGLAWLGFLFGLAVLASYY